MEPFLKNSKRQISKSNKKIVSNRSLYRVYIDLPFQSLRKVETKL
ncbi:hypothetical protein LEP1GSC008_2279 [Leptospira kirschneri serovar Bulgarica str. Nikolaevo]|uniref:Uncharacterized protein n=1 Tax=Leptospira kirschneri serovar Bulgarica str. Nikolaevo TaxID=1240687 RepID=M6F6S1_9LEPT|nr:hypothetical protein LEP1GSC008_2279 [Leptospira kirschneri serovar Bulgarica str. Nikolaevo]